MGNENSSQAQLKKDSDGRTSNSTTDSEIEIDDPEKAIKEIKKLVHGDEVVKDETDKAAELVRPELWEYPFENLVLEGGGNKGIAYAGLLRCLEHAGIARKLRRFAGTSAGAMAATMIALGYTADELEKILTQTNFEPIFKDCSVLVPSFWEVYHEYGWNPGNKFYDWMSEKIAEKSQTHNKMMTFMDLYKERGVELCIVVTNLNMMRTQYCHPKTTPDMQIRDAVRMSMAIPIYFQPYKYSLCGEKDEEKKDFYVDGGVLDNYPIDCFDGWGMSMNIKDSFLRRLYPVNKAGENLKKQFDGFNNKTLGAVLYDATERDPMKANLENRVGANLPQEPKVHTELYKSKHNGTSEWALSSYPKKLKMEAMTAFLMQLGKYENKDIGYIGMEQLTAALSEISEQQAQSLFGKKHDPETVMAHFDKNGDKKLDLTEVLYQFEKDGVKIREFIHGFGRKNVDGVLSYATTLYQTTLLSVAENHLKGDDVSRTVGINTDYIGTLDFKLEEADKEFAISRGYNATKSFLKYYVSANRESKLVYLQGSNPLDQGTKSRQRASQQDAKPSTSTDQGDSQLESRPSTSGACP